MSTAHLISPENEVFPNRIRWTVEECYRLADAGYLQGHYEVIDGEILSKMGKNPPHRLTLMAIAGWLESLFGSSCIQRQDPIHIPGELGIYTEPEPDIAVTIEPTTAYMDAHPGPADILVVVEVSDSSLNFDLTTKALLYAGAGVREYWVADVARRRLIIHRQPTVEGYRLKVRYDTEQVVSLEVRPSDVATVATFFPSSKGPNRTLSG